jgi:DNA-binding beta-propeller fold protein YncE
MVRSPPVRREPVGIAVDPARQRLYAANASTGLIYVIDLVADVVIGTLSIGDP